MLKNKSVRILLTIASDRRARHSESSGVNDTQIRARMREKESVKVLFKVGMWAKLMVLQIHCQPA